jgi:hypothetical protein
MTTQIVKMRLPVDSGGFGIAGTKAAAGLCTVAKSGADSRATSRRTNQLETCK